MQYFSVFFSEGLKFFFLLTPFFVLSMFLSMTRDETDADRRKLAVRIAFAAFIVCTVLFFFGNYLFRAFDITLDAFRIGGGALLFLSAVTLVNGAAETAKIHRNEEDSDIAVVPLAIPVTVGPATTGALLIMGAEAHSSTALQLTKFASLCAALFLLGVILYAGIFIERIIKRRGIVILSKLTGLILSALAAQMIFTGIRNFLK